MENCKVLRDESRLVLLPSCGTMYDLPIALGSFRPARIAVGGEGRLSGLLESTDDGVDNSVVRKLYYRSRAYRIAVHLLGLAHCFEIGFQRDFV